MKLLILIGNIIKYTYFKTCKWAPKSHILFPVHLLTIFTLFNARVNHSYQLSRKLARNYARHQSQDRSVPTHKRNGIALT